MSVAEITLLAQPILRLRLRLPARVTNLTADLTVHGIIRAHECLRRLRVVFRV
jgi:hypothetical protein